MNTGSTLAISGVQLASRAHLLLQHSAVPRWCLEELAGRLAELSGNASFTLAFDLIQEAQQKAEPAAWIAAQPGIFFPPDAASRGVDLAALPVVRVRDGAAAARAAEHLLRSGAFGLVVLDLGSPRMPLAMQSRLLGLAQKHQAVVLCLTSRASGPRNLSLGSLVGWRGDAWRKPLENGAFLCGLRILKDKRRGPSWSHEAIYRGPPGLS